MSSRLADPLYHRLRRTFPPGSSYTRADWDEETMPAVVRQFLEHRLRQHSRREVRQMRRARTDWVDYDHPEMEAAVRTFFDAVAAHTRVPADAWDDTLRHAVDYTTAYLVRPVPVLVEFVYGDQDGPLALESIRQRMQFFRPYPYLREAVRAYAEKRDQEAVARDTFASVLGRVDKGIATDATTDRWLQLLSPLFGVGRYALGQERLPVPLLRTFFEEKGQEGIAERLAEHARGGPEEIGPDALARLIDGAEERATEETGRTPTTASDDSPFRDPPAETAPPDDNASDSVWGVSRSDDAAADSASEPAPGNEEALWKQFQKGKNGTSRAHTAERNGGRDTPRWAQFRQDRSTRADQIADTSEHDAGEPASSAPKKTDRTETSPTEKADDASARSSPDPSSPPSDSGPEPRPGRARTGGASSSAASGDLATLEREILGTENPSHRERYVEELFDGDPSAYQQVLRRLRTADTWSEASDIIASDIFRAHKVNIYSDAAVNFTNTVEARFKERNQRP